MKMKENEGMMTQKELCSRNVSAGLREVLNAVNAAELDRAAGPEARAIDDATADLLATAADCLGRASENLGRRPPKAPQTGGADNGGAKTAKVAAKK